MAFYIKNGIQFDFCPELTIMNEKVYESLFIKIKLLNETFFCGTIYRASSKNNIKESHQSFLSSLNVCLQNIGTNKCFLLGDYNYDLARLNHDNFINDFVELMSDNSLFSLINKPTHITATSATVLDNIWTNSYSNFIQTAVITHPVSDHFQS